MPCGQELDLSYNSIVGDINDYITLTLTKRLIMSYNNLHGVLNKGANLIAGIVCPAAAISEPPSGTKQLACQRLNDGYLQVLNIDNNPDVTGTYPGYIAPRAQQLKTSGLGFT